MVNTIPLHIKAQAELERRKRQAARGAVSLSFRQFVDKVTNGRFIWYRHCVALADALQRLADDDPSYQRLLVFEPPRHGKSEEVSRLFPAYYLYRHPDRFVGINSYAADLAYTLSRAARDNFTSGGGNLRGDASAVKHWQTTSGGGLWAAGVGGPITGKGFHLGIIDDPIKNAEEAQSETIRAKHRDWYDSTFYTRAEPGAAIVIVLTRWNEADLAGYVLSKEEEEAERWHIINFQAIRDSDDLATFPDSCTVAEDWRKDGEALCPERYPIERLSKIAQKIGSYFFAALFQQRPKPKAGNFFKRHWFEIVRAVPSGSTYLRYWDLGGSANPDSDQTCGLLMARTPQGQYIVADVIAGRWSPNDRNAIIRQTAATDKQQYGQIKTVIEQAPGLAKEPTDDLVRQLAGYVVAADKVNKDKESRAQPVQAQSEAGNVKILAGKWNNSFLDEVCEFPTGKHDDQVDPFSGAFNQLAAVVLVQEDSDPFGGYRG